MKEDLTNTMRLLCQLQSIIHTIDELSDSVIFKQGLKQRTNAYLSVIERLLSEVQRDMNIEEMENYSNIVTDIDKLVGTIEIVNS